MKKRTRILLIVLGAVIILGLIGGGVAALAADNSTTNTTITTTTTTTSTNDAFLTALAAKLNVSVDQLKTAIKDARNDVQGQALQDRLQKLVDSGKMTQEQMNEYLQWWNSRPSFSAEFGSGWCGEPGAGMMGGPRHFGGGLRLPVKQ